MRSQQKEIDSLEMEMESTRSYTEESVKTYMDFFVEVGYLKASGIEHLNPENATLKGLIAAQVDKCNCLYLTEMVTQNMLVDLSAEEIVAVATSLISESRMDEKLYASSIVCSEKVKNVMYLLEDLAIHGMNIEKSVDIPPIHDEFWSLDYRMVDVAYEWASGEELAVVLSRTDEEVFVGDFVRLMLRVRDIVHDLICLHQIAGVLSVIPVLSQIEAKIIRGVVSDDSLYGH